MALGGPVSRLVENAYIHMICIFVYHMWVKPGTCILPMYARKPFVDVNLMVPQNTHYYHQPFQPYRVQNDYSWNITLVCGVLWGVNFIAS